MCVIKLLRIIDKRENSMKIHSVKFNFIMNFIMAASSIVFPLITFPYVSRVLMAAGNDTIESISGLAVKSESGIDLRNTINLTFSSGAVATIFSDSECVSDRKGMIYGTEGSIEVINVNNPERINVYSADRPPVLMETIPIFHKVSGYEYELEAADKAIAAGRTEPEAMPWRETLRVLRLCDAMRDVWGIKLGSELE